MPESDRFELDLAAALRDYAEDAPTQARPTELARQFATAFPHRRGLAGPWRLRLTPAMTWTLLVAALLMALVTGLLVGSQLQTKIPAVVPTQRPLPNVAALAPTGIDVLTSDPGAYGRLVADGTGILWAREDGGRLVRFDPATGSGQEWTVGDDAAFATTDIAPARAGGVWLIGGDTLRRFDGTAFRDVIAAPATITAVAEKPDGDLWAATADGRLLLQVGSSWATVDPGKRDPGAVITALAVGPAVGWGPGDALWVGWSEGDAAESGSVMVFAGSGSVTFDGNTTSLLGRKVVSIAPLPNGDVWVATSGGLARSHGGVFWTDETDGLLAGSHAVAAGPDGTVWATDGRTIGAVARFDGQSWVHQGPPDGLPEGGAAWVVPTKEGVYLGTGDGIFRLADDRWERAWPAASATRLKVLLAVSHDELWAREDTFTWPAHKDSGLWHFRDGAWANEPMSPDLATHGPDVMASAPDGTLWAAGAAGVAYLRDGRWTVVDTGDDSWRMGPNSSLSGDRPAAVELLADAIAVDARGTVWVTGTELWNGGWGSARGLWALRLDGTSWVKQRIEGCPITPTSLAIDRAGVLWVGGDWVGDDSGGLARFDGQAWETVRDLEGSPIEEATVLGIAPDGALWIAASDRPRGEAGVVRAARLDGTAWTVVELPADYLVADWPGNLVLAPDGMLWAATGRGPAQYDGSTWSFPYADVMTPVAAPAVTSLAVGPDGTLFGQTPTGIVRFPAAAPQR